MNIVFVILVVLVMPLTQFEGIISHLLGLWAGILILLKMLFQLHVAQDIAWHTNCTVSLEIRWSRN
jgi:ABC-type methionine transport system permease subunit